MLARFEMAGIPMVDLKARFLIPSRFSEDVVVESQISEMGRSSFTVQHRLLKGEALAVEGFEKRVWTVYDAENPGRLKSQAIPDEVRARAGLTRPNSRGDAMATPNHIALLGFGEVGSIFAADLKALGAARIAAYDPLFARPGSRPSQAAAQIGIEACASPSDVRARRGAGDQRGHRGPGPGAAQSILPGIEEPAYFLDLNSASPGVKQAAGQAIDLAGGRYVEAAVMASAPPKRLRTPMLLGGPHAAAFLADIEPWGLDARVFSETVGLASATKMCRSVLGQGHGGAAVGKHADGAQVRRGGGGAGLPVRHAAPPGMAQTGALHDLPRPDSTASAAPRDARGSPAPCRRRAWNP